MLKIKTITSKIIRRREIEASKRKQFRIDLYRLDHLKLRMVERLVLVLKLIIIQLKMITINQNMSR